MYFMRNVLLDIYYDSLSIKIHTMSLHNRILLHGNTEILTQA